MAKYISCGKFDKKYIYIYLIYTLVVLLLLLTFVFVFSTPSDNAEYKDIYNINILFFVFLSFFGQSLFIIVEFILNHYIFENNKNPQTLSPQKSSLLIEYIFNDYSDRITNKDIIIIGCVSVIFLFVDTTKAVISSLRIVKNEQKLIFNEEYYFFQLFFLFVLSIYIYKMKYYKHQYFSIVVILIMGIIRYLIKITYDFENFIFILFQVLITFLESFVIVYSKMLMEYKFFSPYKTCYVFGIINSILILIIYLISTLIPCNSFLCNVKYHDENYFDNIISIFSYYNISKLIALFFTSILLGILRVGINLIIHNYSVCHLFLFIQNQELTVGIYANIR